MSSLTDVSAKVRFSVLAIRQGLVIESPVKTETSLSDVGLVMFPLILVCFTGFTSTSSGLLPGHGFGAISWVWVDLYVSCVICFLGFNLVLSHISFRVTGSCLFCNESLSGGVRVGTPLLDFLLDLPLHWTTSDLVLAGVYAFGLALVLCQ